MILPQTIEYGLRAMAHIAQHPSDDLRASDIATAANIPPHYVAKLLRRLVVAKLLDSRRGKGGGFALSKPAKDIRFIDIMQALDFGFVAGRCSFGYEVCKDSDPCPLHNAWVELKHVFIQWGERTTLASVISPVE